jgi:hypothetical protein
VTRALGYGRRALDVAPETTSPPVVDSAEARDRLNCPLCAYSLRGLAEVAEPRCPECGYRFTWRELLLTRQNLHPYLFEHHKPGHVVSFFATLWRGMRPRKFWEGLNPAHAVRPGRLLVYLLLVTALIAASLAAGWCLTHLGATYAIGTTFRAQGGYYRAHRLPLNPGFYTSSLRFAEPDSIEADFLLTCFAWPWLTLAALLVFQSSMRRARIGFGHVLRCVVYSFDAFLWMFVMGLLAGLVVAFGPAPSRLRFAKAAEQYLVIGLLVAVALATYRLGQAYRRYLKFDHPWATAIASQVLVVLTVLTLIAAFDRRIAQLFW